VSTLFDGAKRGIAAFDIFLNRCNTFDVAHRENIFPSSLGSLTLYDLNLVMIHGDIKPTASSPRSFNSSCSAA
jgi:hypothetical protein